MYFFALVVCMGFTSAPLIGMRLLVSIPFYGFNNILVRLTSCRCSDPYAHPSWWHVSCASVLAFSTSMSHSGFSAFLRLTERKRLAPVCCWLTSVPASTYLFPYPFSELCYFKATYFFHAKVAWCCEGSPPSCVAAIAVTNKIVRILPFSSSLSFIANKKKSIANDFHGASHMVPHPCFWMHVKIKSHF